MSGGEDAGSSDGFDSSLGGLAEELGLDDNGLVGESSLAENLEVAGLGAVDDGGLVKYDYLIL